MGNLVITRKKTEKVIIQTSDGDIEMTIFSISQGQAKLSFNASPSIKIYREELLKKINEEKNNGSN